MLRGSKREDTPNVFESITMRQPRKHYVYLKVVLGEQRQRQIPRFLSVNITRTFQTLKCLI